MHQAFMLLQHSRLYIPRSVEVGQKKEFYHASVH